MIRSFFVFDFSPFHEFLECMSLQIFGAPLQVFAQFLTYCLSEIKYLKERLPLVNYEPTRSVLKKYGDGGVAIIDQWICAHARYFVGTKESTFSFRIQEERDILGFNADTTFNCLCSDKEIGTCEQPTRWRIVY